jgi:hypothetical protein
MEQKLATLHTENNMLKNMFLESHRKNALMQERMERVMKTLYTMFVGGGGSIGGGGGVGMIGNKAPVRVDIVVVVVVVVVLLLCSIDM